MIKIGTIKNLVGALVEIWWDGETLCTGDGVEIMDGQASTVEKAESLAAWLWNAPEWEYEAAN